MPFQIVIYLMPNISIYVGSRIQVFDVSGNPSLIESSTKCHDMIINISSVDLQSTRRKLGPENRIEFQVPSFAGMMLEADVNAAAPR
jgi:hypothetical protein